MSGEHAGAGELAGPDHDVLDHGHPLEDLRRLEGAHHAGTAALLDRLAVISGAPRSVMRAGLQRQVAADDVEQRGLARAVGSDQADQAALGHRNVTLRSTREATKAVADAVKPEDVARRSSRLSLDQPSFNAVARIAPTKPSGSSTTTAPAQGRTGSGECRRAG